MRLSCYKVLVYSGDVDAQLPHTATEAWTANMGFKVNHPGLPVPLVAKNDPPFSISPSIHRQICFFEGGEALAPLDCEWGVYRGLLDKICP